MSPQATRADSSAPQSQQSENTAAPADAAAAAQSSAPTEGDSTAESTSKRGRPKGSSARKTRTVELVLTVTGTADGEWQVELKHGTNRVLQGLQVPAAAVCRAAKELHEDVAASIDEVVTAAREQHRARLEQLETEMARVKQALADLDG